MYRSECAPGLKCFHRTGNTDVPGCLGYPIAHWDYCIKEEIIINLGFDGDERAQNGQLRLCEGDCDIDLECADGLMCSQGYNDAVSGECSGDTIENWNYCITPKVSCFDLV